MPGTASRGVAARRLLGNHWGACGVRGGAVGVPGALGAPPRRAVPGLGAALGASRARVRVCEIAGRARPPDSWALPGDRGRTARRRETAAFRAWHRRRGGLRRGNGSCARQRRRRSRHRCCQRGWAHQSAAPPACSRRCRSQGPALSIAPPHRSAAITGGLNCRGQRRAQRPPPSTGSPAPRCPG